MRQRIQLQRQYLRRAFGRRCQVLKVRGQGVRCYQCRSEEMVQEACGRS